MNRVQQLNFMITGLVLCFFSCSAQVQLGSDVLVEKRLDLVQGKRVGLVTNHTGRLSSGEFLADVLVAKGVSVVALFGPEHGIRGEAAAGEVIHDTLDVKTGAPVFSLYGKNHKPSPEMLQNVDVLIYDIQDVGARFYTYLSTMALSMEAAAEKGIPFVVLDRPDPLGGDLIDGPVLEDSLRSFVGMFPIPVVYGLTCGELAEMINGEHWLARGVHADLTVVRMEGWKRNMSWEETGVRWVPPSPNIPTITTAQVYPATCMLEAINVSEGRGTERPFQTIGAPFIDGGQLSSALTGLDLPGVRFNPITFTPSSSKYKGEQCQGVFIEVADAAALHHIVMGLSVIQQIQKLYPLKLTVNERSFGRLVGQGNVLQGLLHGALPQHLEAEWKKSLDEFLRLSGRYHLYANK